MLDAVGTGIVEDTGGLLKFPLSIKRGKCREEVDF